MVKHDFIKIFFQKWIQESEALYFLGPLFEIFESLGKAVLNSCVLHMDVFIGTIYISIQLEPHVVLFDRPKKFLF